MPCTRCVYHKGYLAHVNSKSEIRGISRHKNNSKRILKRMEVRDVGTKRKIPKIPN